MRPIEAFKPSGKTTPLFFAIVLVVAAVLGGASWLYTALLSWIPWIYVNALVLAGFAFLVGIGAYMAAQLGKNRNAILGAVAGLVIGLVGTGASHYFAYTRTVNEVLDEAADMPGMADSGLSRDEMRAELTREFGFGDFIDARVESGWSLGRSSSSGSGDLTGIFVWLIWGIEAVVLIGAGVVGGYLSAESPFCESCNEWMEEETLLEQRDVDAGEIETVAGATNVERVVELTVTPKEQPTGMALTYVGKQCAKCNGDAYLTVTKHWQEEKKGEVEDKTEELHSDIAISGEDLQHLRQRQSQGTSQAV